jgi:hypothetical protein
MGDDEILLNAVRKAGDQWVAELSFRNASYQMVFQADYADKLRMVGQCRFNWTVEGHEVARLVERIRRREKMTFPHRVVPGPDRPDWPSVYDPDWNRPPLKEVWLVRAERSSKTRWLARLRLDGQEGVYEVDILPSDVWDVLRTPENPQFQSFEYDLMGLIERLHAGERFALPFKLRPRWPTPPDPPALP